MALLFSDGTAVAQSSFPVGGNRRPGAGEWAVKAGYGLAGEMVAFGVVEAATYCIWGPDGDQSDYHWDWAFRILTVPVLVPAGTAVGAMLGGSRYNEYGGGWAAYGGGCVGTLGMMALGFVGLSEIGSRPALAVPVLVVAALLPPVGAAVGHNLTSTAYDVALENQRVLPPSVSFDVTSQAGGHVLPGLSVRLVTIRL